MCGIVHFPACVAPVEKNTATLSIAVAAFVSPSKTIAPAVVLYHFILLVERYGFTMVVKIKMTKQKKE